MTNSDVAGVLPANDELVRD